MSQTLNERSSESPSAFRFEDGPVPGARQIMERFARSTGQSWSHFEEAREAARRWIAYENEGPSDPELRSAWEANGWWVDRRPSRVLLWQPRVKFHMRPAEWAWSMLIATLERWQGAAQDRYEQAIDKASQ